MDSIHIGFFILIALMLNNMKIGRYVHAIGSNGQARWGINLTISDDGYHLRPVLCDGWRGWPGLSSTATPLLGSQYELLGCGCDWGTSCLGAGCNLGDAWAALAQGHQ